MEFWGDYSWIEFIGGALAAFLGVLGAIAAAWWQIKGQENQTAEEWRRQAVVEAASNLTQAIVKLDKAMESAWIQGGLPAAAEAFDDYVASITATRPVLHHVGSWNLAWSLRNDANLILRSWRYVEESIGEPLHRLDPNSRVIATRLELTNEWLRGYSRALPRNAPTKEVPLEWRREASIWIYWINCSADATNKLAEHTLDQGIDVTPEPEYTLWTEVWEPAARETVERWNKLPPA